MTAIEWDNSYVVGVSVIDEQHKHFVGLLNTLYESLESKHPEKISEIIKDVTEYADHRF